jgi:hypothetical protein
MELGGSADRTFAAAEWVGRRIGVAALAVVTEEAPGPRSTAASGELALPLRATGAPASWTARVTVLRWGGLRIVALPGEPFSVTAQRTAALIPGECLVVGYADGSPGYLPPEEEYPYGGYEVEEAHRYYGMSGPFAPGAAEALTKLAADLAGRA